MSNWRNDPLTEKQKKYIEDMQEFCAYPIPAFKGTTKGEAAEYIEKYSKLAHEDVNSPMYGY